MKQMLLLIVFTIAAVGGMDAQQSKKGTAAQYPQFVLSALSQQSGSPASLFLGGRMEKGKKEQFGVLLGGTKSATVDLLDAAGAVIKSVSIGDLLGKSAGTATLLRSQSDEGETRSEAVYEIQLPKGKGELTVRALASGAQQGSKAKVIMSFAVKGAGSVSGVRLSLPVDGQASAQENGFVVASKTQPAAFSAAVFPKPKSVAAEKNVVTVTVQTAPSQGTGEQPLLWMIVEGSSASNAAAAKNEAVAALKSNAQYGADPNVVIVTTANTISTQPNDTVTYTLVCTNIGLGDATDVVVSNPIPSGAAYLEGSAEGQGTSISIEREKASAPQLGAAKSVSWKLGESLKPGAEKIVTFKIIVR